jgi:hypothetical protein
MTDTTANLDLPVIAAAQAQKHVTHNAALRLIDTLVQLSVLDRIGTPPASPPPQDGDRYIVTTGTGAWAGWDHSIAAWLDGVWVRLVPKAGWKAYVADEALEYCFTGSAWGPVPGTGSWTPVLTFATPGDLVVAYSTQSGSYTKIGSLYICSFVVGTSTFTHSTASGALRLTGLPATVSTSYRGSVAWSGITKANYTQVTSVPTGAGIIQFSASGSGQALNNVSAGDMPSGGAVIVNGFVMFTV